MWGGISSPQSTTIPEPTAGSDIMMEGEEEEEDKDIDEYIVQG